MVLDSHVHLWDEQTVRAGWLADPSNDAIRRSFRAADYVDAVGGRTAAPAGDRIDAAIVVTARQSVEENARLLAECDGVAVVAGVVGWVDLTRVVWGGGGDADGLGAAAGAGAGAGAGAAGASAVDGLLGVRHSVVAEAAGWLDRPDVGRGLDAFARTGKVLELLVADRDLPSVVRCADALPSTTIVVDHLGNPPERSSDRGGWAIWHTNLGALAMRQNVRLKLSGATTDARTIDAALQAFGTERMMFGSDWPVSLLRNDIDAELDRWREATAALSESERHQLFTATARTSYGLAS